MGLSTYPNMLPPALNDVSLELALALAPLKAVYAFVILAGDRQWAPKEVDTSDGMCETVRPNARK